MPDELRWVSQGFENRVYSYEKYDVNGYRFHTERHQNTRPNAKTINTGVFTGGTNVEYYGRIENIYALSFLSGAEDLNLVVFKCHWFDPTVRGLKHTPSIGLVEVKPSTVYHGSDVFIVANQATQVYYLPYPCQNEELKGWEVVFKISPHGKLVAPNDDDYDNINPVTYEGEFYQEQQADGDFDILLDGLDALMDDTRNGEAVVNLKDIDMLAKLHLDDGNDDEPQHPSLEAQPEPVRDSDDEAPQEIDYDSDGSYGF